MLFVVFKTRNMELEESFRLLAEEKIDRLGRVDPTIEMVEVEFIFENNPAQGDQRYKANFTAYSKHGTQRIESVGFSPQEALDDGVPRLKRNLRKQREKVTAHR